MRPVKFITNKTSFFISNFENIAEGLHKIGCKVFLRTPDVTDENIGGLGLFCHYAKTTIKRDSINVLEILKFMFSIRTEIKNDPEDMIYTLITILPVLFAGSVLRAYNKSVLLIITGMGTIFSSSKPIHQILRIFVKLMYRYILSSKNVYVITQNTDDLNYFKKVFKFDSKRIFLVKGCGADPEKFRYSKKEFNKVKPVILVPARIIKEKGILEAAKASALLDELNIAHEMRFTSEIDNNNPLAFTEEELSEIKEKCNSVIFLGHQESVVPAMKDSDIICLPTYREGLPTAVVEATAIGRVVITTDTIGCRDVIEHEKTGLLVDVGEYKSITDSIIRLIKDDDLREQLIINANKQYKEEFTKEKIWNKTLDVFKSMNIDE